MRLDEFKRPVPFEDMQAMQRRGLTMSRRRLESPRIHTTIRLSQENDSWLNRESNATGMSRSDITNLAIEGLRDEGRIKELLREVLREEGLLLSPRSNLP